MSTAPGTYLSYLPAVYGNESGPFLAGYLDIFQKLLTGLDDEQLAGRKGIQQLLAADVVGNLFYPRFSFLFPHDASPLPPISGLKGKDKAAVLALFNSYIGIPPAAPGRELSGASAPDPDAPFLAWLNDFLGWLGEWVDLVLESNWTVDKKRLVIAQILALYRARGTAQGLGWLIDLWFDLPLTLSGCKRDDPTTPVKGPVTVTVANPESRGITLADRAGTPQTFVLTDRGSPDAPLVSGYAPWIFDVIVTLPTAAVPDFMLTQENVSIVLTLLAQLRSLIDRVEPAGSRHCLKLVPGMLLEPNAADLGATTLL
jgi:hypothetical protein